jgi:hypothetical protein
LQDTFDFDAAWQAQRGENVFSRVCAGYIDSIDTENGVVIVALEDFIGSRPNVELSFDYISSVGPGWFRFMPQIGDKVLCGFRPNNELEILRYKSVSYSNMAQLAADANPAFLFRQLNPGEFEIMSKGLAGVWGSADGILSLTGGLAEIDLTSSTNQITYNATLHYWTGDNSELHFGTIRRNNPLTIYMDESDSAPGIPNKEIYTNLVQNIAGLTQILFNSTIGQVMDYTPAIPQGVFTPRLSPDTGEPLAADVNLYTADGIQQIEFRADQLGNMRLDMPSSAVYGLNIVASLSPLMAKFLSIDLSAVDSAAISGATAASLSCDLGGTIDLGATVGIKNDITDLKTVLTQLITILSTLFTTMSAATPLTVVSNIAVPSAAAVTSLTEYLVTLSELLT